MRQPVECTLWTDCFIQQYVDRDAGPGALDFTCGTLSYDGHKGTDFALHSLDAMESGVNVLAAADGIVSGIRDNEPDTGSAQAAPGKECGNGVALDHGNGWVTQYCHLRRGTVAVRPGQKISAGTPLGQVGLSGRTEFPHLHISVRKNRAVVDPFDTGKITVCGTGGEAQLWDTPIAYQPGGIIEFALSDTVPDFDAIKAGKLPRLSPNAMTPALVLYAHMYGTQEGDIVSFHLTGPSGTVFSQEIALDRTQARSFRALGKRNGKDGWLKGQYEGTASLVRGSSAISTKTLDFKID